MEAWARPLTATSACSATQPTIGHGRRNSDQGLDLIASLWSGEVTEFHGQHYNIGPVRFTPTPAQGGRFRCGWEACCPRGRVCDARRGGMEPCRSATVITPSSAPRLTTLPRCAISLVSCGVRLTVSICSRGPRSPTPRRHWPKSSRPTSRPALTWWIETARPPRPDWYEQLLRRIRSGPRRQPGLTRLPAVRGEVSVMQAARSVRAKDFDLHIERTVAPPDWEVRANRRRSVPVGLFPLPAQRVGPGGDPCVSVLRVGDVRGFGALQEPDVLTAAPAGVKNAVPGCPANSRCSWPPPTASITGIPSSGTGAPWRCAVRFRGDDEQVTLRLEASVDRDLQVAIEVIMHVEAVLVDELAERCRGHAIPSVDIAGVCLPTGFTCASPFARTRLCPGQPSMRLPRPGR